jgi:hypothetical protein
MATPRISLCTVDSESQIHRTEQRTREGVSSLVRFSCELVARIASKEASRLKTAEDPRLLSLLSLKPQPHDLQRSF